MKKLTLLIFFFIGTLYVYSQSGWVQLNGNTSYNLYCTYFFNVNTGFVTGQAGLILKTTNGGTNWSTVTSGTTSNVEMITFPGVNTGYYLDASSHLGKTTNGGLNWFTAATITPQSANTMFFVDSLNGHFAGYWGGYPEGWWLKTTNSGINFSGASLCQQYLTSVFFPSLLVGYIGSSTNFVGYPVIKKTINSGITWFTMPIGITNSVTINSLWFIDEYTGWAGISDGRVYKTINGGNNWTYFTNTGYPVYNIHMENMFTGYYACGSPPGGSVFKTTNGGDNWTECLVTSGGQFNWVFFLNTMTGYAVGNGGKIYKTTIGGENVPAAPKNLNVNAISTSKIVLNWEDKSFNENGFRIFRSTDVGVTWSLRDSVMQNVQDYTDSGLTANSGYFYRICAYNIAGNSFYSQIDWDTTYALPPQYVQLNYLKTTIDKAIAPTQTVLDTTIVTLPFIGFSVQTRDVEITIDTMMATNVGQLDFVLIHQNVYDTIIYRVGGAGSNFIKTTLDDSAAVPINSGSPPFTGRFKPSKPLAQFRNIDPRGTWILRIFNSTKTPLTGVIKSWSITITYNNPSIGIQNISTDIPDKFKLFQNYPNPFNPSTKIKFQIKDSRFVSLKVYDILGKEVDAPVNEMLNAGEYEAVFDGSELPSGIYF